MNNAERADLRSAIADLRSGDPNDIARGERVLARLAGYSLASCSCPVYPTERSPTCYAHGYVIKSALVAATRGTSTVRGAVMAIRGRYKEDR